MRIHYQKPGNTHVTLLVLWVYMGGANRLPSGDLSAHLPPIPKTSITKTKNELNQLKKQFPHPHYPKHYFNFQLHENIHFEPVKVTSSVAGYDTSNRVQVWRLNKGAAATSLFISDVSIIVSWVRFWCRWLYCVWKVRFRFVSICIGSVCLVWSMFGWCLSGYVCEELYHLRSLYKRLGEKTF